MAERACACGCGRSLEGRRRNTHYALAVCRPRSDEAVEGSGSGRERSDASLRERAGGLQVSYRKAVEAMAYTLQANRWRLEDARRVAEITLRDALSEAQRARLDERRTG